MNLVDSSAWLAYFAGEPNSSYFAAAIEDTDSLIVPTVCLYEVFRVILRERDENEAFKAVATMQQGTVADLTAELSIEAAAIGHEAKLAFADSIIFATSKRYEATIWTQDEHFSGLDNVRYRKKSNGP